MKSIILLIMLTPVLAHAAWYDGLMPGGAYAAAIIMVIEFVLGKTDWVKANSVVELVLNGILKLFKKDQEI